MLMLLEMMDIMMPELDGFDIPRPKSARIL